MFDKRTYSLDLAGRRLTIETGELARQAGAAVLVTYGETVVLVTATVAKQPREGIDFLPLRVDVEERQYAAGKIPGSFFRREGRPSERAILVCRLIDRPIRPLFPKGFSNDIQVMATILSFDGENFPELGAMIGASAALSLSETPFNGPIGAVIVGLVDGELIINPTGEQLLKSDMELVVVGTKDAIIMVEAEMNEVSEEKIIEAVELAHREIKRIIAWQEGIVAEIGKPKLPVLPRVIAAELEAAVRAEATGLIRAALMTEEKQAREESLAAVREQVKAAVAARLAETGAGGGGEPAALPGANVESVLKTIEKEEMRRAILDEGRRSDGRGTEEIRPIDCRVGLLPRTHGSGLFTRGQTQVLTVVALGSVRDRQMIDAIGELAEFKRYLHHYNFPPFSTGEVKPLRPPGRREVGHGALAERALVRMIPTDEEFPYTIRLVSEVLESNGSSSMASVCGSTLALMDAGVPLRQPVAGIAMGLIKEGERVAILSDIQGMEDFLGDMDFKVAGTRAGVTALQMDIKITGLDSGLLRKALAQAREGRLFILEKMLGVIPEPRAELSRYAPRIIILQINPEKIRDVIGPGGKMINKIISECGVGVDVEDDGKIYISGPAEGGKRAEEWVRQLTREVQIGETFLGRVARIQGFGAFVEILPGKEGLVRVGELADQYVPRVEDLLTIGDRILVKVIEIDDQGRMNLSRKQALCAAGAGETGEVLEKGGVLPVQEGPPRQDRGDRPGRGGGPGNFRRREGAPADRGRYGVTRDRG